MRCSKCGAYVDEFEWPESDRENFRPDLCYSCYQAEQQAEADEAEEAENFDPNTEFGMSEVVPDPEDDDAPDLGQPDEIQDEQEESTDEQQRSDVSNEEQNIRNITRMLFG